MRKKELMTISKGVDICTKLMERFAQMKKRYTKMT